MPGATVPVIEAPAASAPTDHVLAPALRRRLHHAAMIKRLARRVTVGVTAIAAMAGIGVGLPAYASSLEEVEAPAPRPQAQSLTVAASTPLVGVIRDGYTVVVPPKLQYPLLTGTGITSGFGPRGGRMHQGADIFPGYGTPIYSIAAGVVVEASSGGDYGNQVTIEHVIDGEMVVSRYAHMAPGTMAVAVGDQVGVGQYLGGVGETGNAQGAHLHFEIRPGGGAAVDPYPWIAARL